MLPLFCIITTLMALAGEAMASYVLEDSYTPSNFFSMFEFFTGPDPTSGLVQFVNQSAAQAAGMIETSYGSVYMGVDHTSLAPNGRQSVRITSQKAYNHGLIILDVAHMPEGCGTWPAFWTVGPNWPSNGEIDIIEGVNSQTTNAMTLHTGPGCAVTNTANLFTGTVSNGNCDVNAAGQPTNAGCGIVAPAPQTYGTGFNANNGGVYAMDWTSSGIAVYFFPRTSIPADITSGQPNPSSWGAPLAMWTSSGCPIDSIFKNQQIVFDTTFCGAWAGNVWSSDSTCSAKAATCDTFVANHPSAFANAYWSINSLNVYQQAADSPSVHPSSSAVAAATTTSPRPAATSVGSAPVGIASSLPAIVSSLAPIPASTDAAIVTTTAVWTRHRHHSAAVAVAMATNSAGAFVVVADALPTTTAAPVLLQANWFPDATAGVAGTTTGIPVSAMLAAVQNRHKRHADAHIRAGARSPNFAL